MRFVTIDDVVRNFYHPGWSMPLGNASTKDCMTPMSPPYILALLVAYQLEAYSVRSAITRSAHKRANHIRECIRLGQLDVLADHMAFAIGEFPFAPLAVPMLARAFFELVGGPVISPRTGERHVYWNNDVLLSKVIDYIKSLDEQ